MKKFLLLVALGVSLCANAQLTVFENGKVRIGNCTSDTNPTPTTLTISNLTTGGTLPEGSISFGNGFGAIVSGCSGNGTLELYGAKNLNIGVGMYQDALSLTSSLKLTSAFKIYAPAFLTSSDARLKTNIESLSESFLRLKDVNAVSYNLAGAAANATSAIAAEDASAEEIGTEEIIADERTHFGFIAQEIQEIFPNLVVEGEDGMLAIDYIGFIPLLVEAYKDLSNKVKEQEEFISEVLNPSGPRYMPAAVNSLSGQKAVLKQNKPNPFNTTTSIECIVPQEVASAFICVYDLQGKQVSRIEVGERGNVAVVIEASSLTPGMYIYALIADGAEIDSKRMIITD